MDLEFFGYKSKPTPFGVDMGFSSYGNDVGRNFHA